MYVFHIMANEEQTLELLGNKSVATEYTSFQGNQMRLNMDIVNRGAFHTFHH